MNKAAIALSILALILSTIAILQMVGLREIEMATSSAEDMFRPARKAEERLTVQMERLHHFADKLYLSTYWENTDLATFYVNKIEGIIEDISFGQYEQNGLEIGALARDMLRGPLDGMAASIQTEEQEAMESAWYELAAACNDCHAVAEREYIQIEAPDKGMYTSQRFMK